jgi:hypothetical protein
MTLIRVVLVPFWRGLTPAEFRGWFRQHGKRIGAVMIPLGATTAAATLTAAVLDRSRGSRAAAAATMCVAIITVAVNEPINERFWSAEPMADQETTQMLERWARWHNARVALGTFAVITSARRLRH